MAKKRTDLKIPYGIMDFRRLRREGYYYVDKTEYLAQMEARDSFIFFVRPRRFAFAYDGKWREFFELVSKNFAETTPIRGGIDGEVRMQGYFQCEMGHLPQFITCPELEMSHGNCDFFLFPERHYYGDVPHSYIVEFKYVKKGAKKAELEAQRQAGVAQLKAYAKDKKIPALAKGTTLHLILVQYRGPKMCNCELVGEKRY